MPDFLTFVIPAANDSNSIVAIPLVLCFSGIFYYLAIYFRYRNTDKRHGHENETVASIQNLQRHDQLIEHRRGLRNSSMSGRNENVIEGSLSKSALPIDINGLGNAVIGKMNK